MGLEIPEKAQHLRVIIAEMGRNAVRIVGFFCCQGSDNPIFGLLNSITRPVLEPFRRLLPDLGGIDLSPMVAIIALYLLEMLLLPPLKALLGMPLNF